MSHHRLTQANEPITLLEEDVEHQRRLGLLAVWDEPSESDIGVLHTLLEELPRRQRGVVIRHYGLDGRRGRSLRKVAQELRISPTHARRLERRALAQLLADWPTPDVSR